MSPEQGKLVEKMAEAGWDDKSWNELPDEGRRIEFDAAKRMLSVVKANIGAVAKVCPDAGGMFGQCINGQIGFLMMGEEHYKDCPTCKGIGVVAKD